MVQGLLMNSDKLFLIYESSYLKQIMEIIWSLLIKKTHWRVVQLALAQGLIDEFKFKNKVI